MADFQSHITTSTVVGIAGGLAANAFYDVPAPTCVLAGGMCSAAGMLPDLDSESGVPLRESIAFAAAVIPLVLIERFAKLGWSLEVMILAGAAVYLFIRFGVAELIKNFTVHRGMFHSIPALLISGQLTFLIYDNENVFYRLFVAGAVMAGYASHLLLDEFWSMEFGYGLPQFKRSFGTATKFLSGSFRGNLVVYSLVFGLGYLVTQETGWRECVSPWLNGQVSLAQERVQFRTRLGNWRERFFENQYGGIPANAADHAEQRQQAYAAGQNSALPNFTQPNLTQPQSAATHPAPPALQSSPANAGGTNNSLGHNLGGIAIPQPPPQEPISSTWPQVADAMSPPAAVPHPWVTEPGAPLQPHSWPTSAIPVAHQPPPNFTVMQPNFPTLAPPVKIQEPIATTPRAPQLTAIPTGWPKDAGNAFTKENAPNFAGTPSTSQLRPLDDISASREISQPASSSAWPTLGNGSPPLANASPAAGNFSATPREFAIGQNTGTQPSSPRPLMSQPATPNLEFLHGPEGSPTARQIGSEIYDYFPTLRQWPTQPITNYKLQITN
ncbi:MAG: metal-dependent hydrolase [Pirellulales bacterium]|nr:metal-dependent hydrolase [Pirellulales bacterium]